MTDDLTTRVAEGDALDDFLISLADGVASAQQQLNQLVINSPSGNGILYQIPKLEFELKLQVDTQQQPATTQTADSKYRKKSFLKVATPATSQQSSAASTIKGVLMATPVNSGKPGFVLELNMGLEENNSVPIRVRLEDTLGEAQVGVSVEINIDRMESNEINQEEGRDQALSPNTLIAQGLVKTDSQGIASTSLKIDTSEISQNAIVITADAMSVSESLIYRVS